MSIIFKTSFFVLLVLAVIIYNTDNDTTKEQKYVPPGVITVEELPPIEEMNDN